MAGTGKAALAVAAEQAVRDGFVNTTGAFVTRYGRAEVMGYTPDWSLYRPARYQQPIPTAVINPAPSAALPEPQGGQRVLVIGDLHQDPRHPDRAEVLTWIARHASQTRPDRIVQIGDWSTWDSVSQHDRNDTVAGKLKPSIRADMDNLASSLRAFEAGRAPDYKPKMAVTLGNHENRLERFENANPETHQTFTLERDQLFSQFGWKVRPFGEIYYVEGVGFTHHATNALGRAFGGETAPQRVANKTSCPLVVGHSHRRALFESARIGPADSVTIVEVGCALPWGVVENYSKHSMTGWFWGVCEMTVSQSTITDIAFVSMIELARRHS